MGKLNLKELDDINSFLVKICLSKGLKIDVITFCPHHPHKGFENEIDYLKKGGKLVFLLPRFHIIDKKNYKNYLNKSFIEQSYSY